MMKTGLDAIRSVGLRRAAAALVVAAIPVLHNAPVVGGLHYGAVWSYYNTDYWSNLTVDVLLYATCFLSPLNAAVCGGLALL